MPCPWWISQSTIRILGTDGQGDGDTAQPHSHGPPLSWATPVLSPCPHTPARPTLCAPCPHAQSSRHTPVQPMPLPGMLGRQGHVVEHTEPIGCRPLAVMPRRPAGRRGAQGIIRVVTTGHGNGGERGGPHLTRASPLRAVPVSTASTSCSAAPAASRAQWKVS